MNARAAVANATRVALVCITALLGACTARQTSGPLDTGQPQVSAANLQIALLPDQATALQANLLSTMFVQLFLQTRDGTAIPDDWAVRFTAGEGAFVVGNALLSTFNAPLGPGPVFNAVGEFICARPQQGARVPTPRVTAEVRATVLDGSGRPVGSGVTQVLCVDAVDLADIVVPEGDDGLVRLTREVGETLAFSVTDVDGALRNNFTIRVRCAEPTCALQPATTDGTPLPLPTTLVGRFGFVSVPLPPPASTSTEGGGVRSTWVLETTTRLGHIIQKPVNLLYTWSPRRGALQVFHVTPGADAVVAERAEGTPYRILLDTRRESTVQLRMRAYGDALNDGLPRPDAPAVPTCQVRQGAQPCPTLPSGVFLSTELEASWSVTLPAGAAPGEVALGATLELPDGRRFTSVPEVVVDRGTWNGLHVWPPAATVRGSAPVFFTATWHHPDDGHLVPRTYCPSVYEPPANAPLGLTRYRSDGNVWSWAFFTPLTGVYTLRTDTLDAAALCGTGAPVLATSDATVTVDDALRLRFGTPPHPVGVVGSPWPQSVALPVRLTDMGGVPLLFADVAFRLEEEESDAWVEPYGSTWLDGEARVLLVAGRRVGPVTVVATVGTNSGPMDQRHVVDILGE